MALNSASTELYGIEKKMLDALSFAYDNWKQTGGPLPASLVKLMSETHACVRERIKRQFGVDANLSTREMLIEVRQLEQQLLEMLEHEDQEAQEAREDEEATQ